MMSETTWRSAAKAGKGSKSNGWKCCGISDDGGCSQRSQGLRARPDNLTTSVGKYAAAFVGIGTAISGVSKLFGKMKKDMDDAANSLTATEDSMKRLVQIASSPEDLQNLIAKSRSISKQYGISQSRAADLVFTGRSEDRMGQIDFLAGLSKFTNPEALMKSVTTFQRSFGRQEAGSDRQLVNKFLAAANVSRLSVEEIAPQAAAITADAGRVGFSDEAVLAAFSQAVSATKSPEMAATRLRAFATVAGKEGFAAPTFTGALRNFMQLPEDRRKKILESREEFAGGFELVRQNFSQINQAMAQITRAQMAAGTSQSMVNQKLAMIPGTDLGRIQQVRIEEQRAELARQGELGSGSLERRAAIAEGTAQDFETGIGYGIFGALTSGARGIAERLGVGAEGMNTLNQAIQSGGVSRRFGPSFIPVPVEVTPKSQNKVTP